MIMILIQGGDSGDAGTCPAANPGSPDECAGIDNYRISGYGYASDLIKYRISGRIVMFIFTRLRILSVL